MKNNRKGKANCWSTKVIKNLRSRLVKYPNHKLIFEISLWTGERIGAIVQLKVSDVYGSDGKVLDTITFGSTTRKASKHGLAQTRQIYIHPELEEHLKNFTPPNNGYLFASNSKSGHITTRAVDKLWRSILADYGYQGYTTHSSRRWVINQLRKAGIGIVTIAETMAIDVTTVRKYLDVDLVACQNAIATLSV